MEYGYSQPRDLWEEKIHIRSWSYNRQYDWQQKSSARSYAINDLCPQGHVVLIDRIVMYFTNPNMDGYRFFITKLPIDPFNANAFRAPDIVWAFNEDSPIRDQAWTTVGGLNSYLQTVVFPTPIVIRPEDTLNCRLISTMSTPNLSLSLGCRLGMVERGTWPYTDARTEAGSRGAPNHSGGAGPIDAWTPTGDGLPLPEEEYRQGDAKTSGPGEGRMSRDVRRPQS